MIVYVDVLFAVHSVMNAVLLFVTAQVMQQNLRMWRWVLASVIGSLYVVALFLWPHARLGEWLIKGMISFVMLYGAFGWRGWQTSAHLFMVFYTLHVVMIGFVLVWDGLFEARFVSWRMLVGRTWAMTEGVSSGVLLFVCLAVVGVGQWSRTWVRRRTWQASLVHVEVCVATIRLRCVGLIDTGNHLHDPLSGLPVMVMEVEAWAQHLPPSWVQAVVSQGDPSMDACIDCADSSCEALEWARRFRHVTYRGLDYVTRGMVAFLPDEVVVLEKEGQYIPPQRVLVGLRRGTMRPDGAYTALLHPAMVRNRG